MTKHFYLTFAAGVSDRHCMYLIRTSLLRDFLRLSEVYSIENVRRIGRKQNYMVSYGLKA